MKPDPLVSLVLPVKNGLPHIQTTIAALHRQTYRNFELVVQDGGSTDGTLAYLNSITGLPRVEIVSQPDSGIGQAYNRGIVRSRGELLCLIASDEYLDDDALQKGVEWFARHPNAAVIYGAVRLMDGNGNISKVFFPPLFELAGFMRNELSPSTAGFLNRERLGEELYYDESLKTCPDYDFWIRVGSRFGASEIVQVSEPIMVARGDRASTSYRAESFAQFCRDKLFVLDRFLGRDDTPETQELRKGARAGILTWAAESVLQLEGVSPGFLHWCAEAAKIDPHSRRLHMLAKTTWAFRVDPASGQFAVREDYQVSAPADPTQSEAGFLQLTETLEHWEGAAVERGATTRVKTGDQPWAYAARIPIVRLSRMNKNRCYWAKLEVQAHTGQIGIALHTDDDELCHERLISPYDGRVVVFVSILPRSARWLMIRNGSLPGPSVLEIFSATMESCPRGNSWMRTLRRRVQGWLGG